MKNRPPIHENHKIRNVEERTKNHSSISKNFTIEKSSQTKYTTISVLNKTEEAFGPTEEMLTKSFYFVLVGVRNVPILCNSLRGMLRYLPYYSVIS